MKAYRGVNGVLYRQLIPVEKIVITRAEGPTHLVGRPHTLHRWSQCRGQLMEMGRWAPRDGGYDKCDFTIHWRDGTEWSGRYDLQHTSRDMLDLAGHVRGTLTWIRDNLRQERPQLVQDVERMLGTLDLCQRPIPIEAGQEIEIIRDYILEPLTSAEYARP